jgi:transcriptional regulator with XRE-family HTH domain
MPRTKKPATEGLNGALVATIVAELAARRITRQQLAEMAGISPNSLANYLSPDPRRARVMPIDFVADVARGLRLLPSELVHMAEMRGLTLHQVLHAPGSGKSDPSFAASDFDHAIEYDRNIEAVLAGLDPADRRRILASLERARKADTPNGDADARVEGPGRSDTA